MERCPRCAAIVAWAAGEWWCLVHGDVGPVACDLRAAGPSAGGPIPFERQRPGPKAGTRRQLLALLRERERSTAELALALYGAVTPRLVRRTHSLVRVVRRHGAIIEVVGNPSTGQSRYRLVEEEVA